MFYIQEKGDFTPFADKRSIFVTHPDGTTQEIKKIDLCPIRIGKLKYIPAQLFLFLVKR